MTTVITKPLGFDLNRRHPARRRPALPVMRKPTRPFPAISQHVPVTPRNRSYLRSLRQAEMAAWNAAASAGLPDVHFDRQQAAERERRDLRAFGLIALLASTVVVLSLWKSQALAAGWAALVQLAHQLIS